MKRPAFKRAEFLNHTYNLLIILMMTLSASTITTRSFAFAEDAKGSTQQTPVQDSTQTDVRELKRGEPLERELKGGEGHSYRLTLIVGQYLRVVVVQKGIDVVVRLFGPDGQKISELDSSNGMQGPEPVSLIVQVPGNYGLDVRTLDAKAASGRYELKVEELRDATSRDRVQMIAQKAFEEANQLRDQQTAESRRQAIRKYEEALPLFRIAEDRQSEANTLGEIGWIYAQLSEDQKALEYYGRALPLHRAVENRQREARTLNNIGIIYWQQSEPQKALECYDKALLLSRAISDRQEEAKSLNNLGLVYSRLNEQRRALEYYDQSLLLKREMGDRRGEGITLINIGTVYNSLGDVKKTVEYLVQALPLFRLIGDRPVEGIVLNNIGYAYFKLGELPKALEYYEQSLPISRVAGNRHLESTTLDNMGQIYNGLNEPEKALQHYDRALEIKRLLADRSGQAITLNNIGLVYISLGEMPRALEFLEQALSLKRVVGDRREEAYTLDSIGAVYFRLGELRRALDYHNQSLNLKRAVGDRYGEANSLTNIGAVYDQLGESRKALEYFDHALPLRQSVGDRWGEGITLFHLGKTYFSLGKSEEASSHFERALSLHRTVGDQNSEAKTLQGIARAERDRGRLNEARAQIETALNIIESTRSRLSSQQLRTSFSASRQSFYEFYIDLLMRLHQKQPAAGHDAAALQVSERARARSLLDILTEARADIRHGVDPVLLERERSVQQRLNARTESLTRLLSGKYSEEQETRAKKEIEALVTDYQDIQAEIRIKSPRYAALTQPRPLSSKEIQQLLDKDTLLLEYALGEERSYLWVVTPNSIKSFELPKRAEIETASRLVYDLFTARNRALKFEEPDERRARIAKADLEYPQAAGALGSMLLGPIANHIKTKRLLIVSDGVLQYLPFAALPLPDSSSQRLPNQTYLPLIARYEVVNLPSASTLAVLRKELFGRKPAPRTVAVLADPVFDGKDERVKVTKPGTSSQASGLEPTKGSSAAAASELTRSVRELASEEESLFPLPRLPFTRREAEAIVALAPAKQYEKALDFTASRATALDPGLSRYRYVHFATHVILNSRHPELSGIVLSLVDQDGKTQDGFLLAHQVFNLNLPAELVVLSGCKTGLGKEVKGEGLQSLTRGFMYAGSARVLVSLWDVNDRSTAELMANFYEGVLGKQRLKPAAALRQAQITMWKSPQWRAPYYWAAFALHGEHQ